MDEIEIVVVGSENPMKIDVFNDAFEDSFSNREFDLVGRKTDSYVSKQPKGERETALGAYNRIKAIRFAEPNASYWVSMESGLVPTILGYYNVGYTMIFSKDGICTHGRTAEFYIPTEVAKLSDKGLELSDACDQIFGTKNVGQSQGIIGVLTDGLFNRSDYYLQAITYALLPHKLQEQYKSKEVYTEENLKKVLNL